MSDDEYMALAIAEAKKCTPVPDAYCVGTVLVKDGKVIGAGYSRAQGRMHAEEMALKNATADPAGSTTYTTMEPCSRRVSSPVSCTELLIRARVKRVVFAAREPPTFQRCEGEKLLTEAGIEVTHLKQYEDDSSAIGSPLRP